MARAWSPTYIDNSPILDRRDGATQPKDRRPIGPAAAEITDKSQKRYRPGRAGQLILIFFVITSERAQLFNITEKILV